MAPRGLTEQMWRCNEKWNIEKGFQIRRNNKGYTEYICLHNFGFSLGIVSYLLFLFCDN